MKILIQNISTFNGSKLAKQDICVEKGKIRSDKTSFLPDLIIDGKGLAALPAFIDLHCHLRDPGQTHKEDIISGANSAAAGGFYIIACMPNTSPTIDSPYLVKYVLDKAKDAPIKVLPIAALTKGLNLTELVDFAALKKAGAVAFSDDGKAIKDGSLMKNAILCAKANDLLVFAHSEDASISDGGVCNEGVYSALYGLKGISPAAEEVGVARDIFLAEALKASIHICHLSTKNAVELVRAAKKRGVAVTAESCPHYFALTDELIKGYNTNAKINPPLRTEADRAAIIEGLIDGTIDAIATDHAPHHREEKTLSFTDAAFGSTGFETAFAASYTHLVRAGHIKISKLVSLMSRAPSNILKVAEPKIADGSEANFVIVDLDNEWTFDAKKSISRAQNSVFDGQRFFGKVLATISGGKIAFKDEKLPIVENKKSL